MSSNDKQGSLVCVGTGITLGAHISTRTENLIKSADLVFCLMADSISELWIKEMHPNVISLQQYYQEGKSRLETYKEMVAEISSKVRDGNKVCGVFYGHPGIFAKVPHDAIKKVKALGLPAHMEPAVSADACLFADLGIDPGKFGCQQHEATQFLMHNRLFDPSSYLILWQVGVVGDRSLKKFSTDKEEKTLLMDRLLQKYPKNHQITIYEAATLPSAKPRIETIALSELANSKLNMHTTLAIPPA